MAEQAARAVH
jgi:hypothetical protein